MRNPRDIYFDPRLALGESNRHHAVRFMAWRAGLRPHGPRAEEYYRVEVNGEQRSDFLVTTIEAGGVCWWYVYRRTNAGGWEWQGKMPFAGEAAGLIDDIVTGRERVYFGGIKFERHGLKSKPG